MKIKVLTMALLLVTVLGGCGCKKQVSEYHMDLKAWGVFDNQSDYSEVFNAYDAVHPFVDTITYKKFAIEEYKQDLLNALAAGNGPDIFMIQNSWLPDFEDKVVPAPIDVINEQTFRTHFVDVAAQDGLINGEVYAVPLSVDSLALYYNKDIFNAAGITTPPRTWDAFDDAVKRITRKNDLGAQLLQSAAAIGTVDNVNRAVDLVSVLMMQGGAQMSRDTAATFDESVTVGGETRTPGKQALLYYTQFARGGSDVYTWNADQHYSLDAFAEGRTAMMLNYSWHYNTLKSKNEKLNFAVAPLPQIDGSDLEHQLNYANYWMFVVAKNKTPEEQSDPQAIPVTNDMRVREAWQFLKALTLPSADGVDLVHAASGEAYHIPLPFDLAEQYLETTGKPAARKDLLEAQKTDVRLAPFAAGNLIARSWYHPNAQAVERVMADMITQVNTGQETAEDAIQLAAQRATQLMQ